MNVDPGKFDEETLMAYVDGELDVTMRAAVDAAIARDPELARRIERHRALRAAISRAYDDVLDEPVPDALLRSLRSATRAPSPDAPLPAPVAVVTLPRREARRATSVGWTWPHWAGMAASLVVGVLLAQLLRGARSGADAASVIAEQGQMFAAGALSAALDGQASGPAADGGPVRIALTFRAKNGGAYCRSFVSREAAAGRSLAGLACRDGERWRVPVLAETAGEADAQGDGYRQAASGLPAPVREAVDALIDGAPLDADAEAAVLRGAWERRSP